MAELTPKQLQRKLNDFGRELSVVYTKAAYESGLYVLVLFDKRIFKSGLDAKNKKIGDYSTKPMLIGSSAFPVGFKSFNPLKTKSGRRKLEWVTLKDGKRLAVLPGGYKQFREINGGLQTRYVDLSFSGKLQQSIKVVQKKNAADVVIRGDLSIAKARGNEDRFNTEIFALTKRERKQILNRVRDNVNKQLKKFFKD